MSLLNDDLGPTYFYECKSIFFVIKSYLEALELKQVYSWIPSAGATAVKTGIHRVLEHLVILTQNQHQPASVLCLICNKIDLPACLLAVFSNVCIL